jgi:hypothetical protein
MRTCAPSGAFATTSRTTRAPSWPPPSSRCASSAASTARPPRASRRPRRSPRQRELVRDPRERVDRVGDDELAHGACRVPPATVRVDEELARRGRDEPGERTGERRTADAQHELGPVRVTEAVVLDEVRPRAQRTVAVPGGGVSLGEDRPAGRAREHQ